MFYKNPWLFHFSVFVQISFALLYIIIHIHVVLKRTFPHNYDKTLSYLLHNILPQSTPFVAVYLSRYVNKSFISDGTFT